MACLDQHSWQMFTYTWTTVIVYVYVLHTGFISANSVEKQMDINKSGNPNDLCKALYPALKSHLSYKRFPQIWSSWRKSPLNFFPSKLYLLMGKSFQFTSPLCRPAFTLSQWRGVSEPCFPPSVLSGPWFCSSISQSLSLRRLYGNK